MAQTSGRPIGIFDSIGATKEVANRMKLVARICDFEAWQCQCRTKAGGQTHCYTLIFII